VSLVGREEPKIVEIDEADEMETDVPPAAAAAAAAATPDDAAIATGAEPGGAISQLCEADEEDKEAETKLQPNKGNGANLATYSWTQTLEDVELRIPLPGAPPAR
jgi:hypothetical protein